MPLQWCKENSSVEQMGAADNAIVYALFEARIHRRHSIVPWYFPVEGWRVPTKTKNALCQLVKLLQDENHLKWPEIYHAYLTDKVMPLLANEVEMSGLLQSEEFN